MGREDIQQNPAEHNPGQEMRQVNHGLDRSAKQYDARFVQKQRQDNRPDLVGDDLGDGDE